ncbi:hypothetical protein BpHYR1_010615 [Brachionus plicatilis]|uniref:Uncharacterized protein n=1 Tax=Brachionus plicatilis TaxID=10195 RepID=A0A3M7S6M5_BRAPC|nr:hypothetical protein BpHYR1_010615 [Brachionus plicatilis]
MLLRTDLVRSDEQKLASVLCMTYDKTNFVEKKYQLHKDSHWIQFYNKQNLSSDILKGLIVFILNLSKN